MNEIIGKPSSTELCGTSTSVSPTLLDRTIPLKALDTIGNCQRGVFSLGVSQYMHKITNLWKFWLNRSLKLQENNDRKITLVAQFECFQMPKKTYYAWSLLTFDWEITIFSKNSLLLQRELFPTINSIQFKIFVY